MDAYFLILRPYVNKLFRLGYLNLVIKRHVSVDFNNA